MDPWLPIELHETVGPWLPVEPHEAVSPWLPIEHQADRSVYLDAQDDLSFTAKLICCAVAHNYMKGKCQVLIF